jgi:hypothetical protein
VQRDNLLKQSSTRIGFAPQKTNIPVADGFGDNDFVDEERCRTPGHPLTARVSFPNGLQACFLQRNSHPPPIGVHRERPPPLDSTPHELINKNNYCSLMSKESEKVWCAVSGDVRPSLMVSFLSACGCDALQHYNTLATEEVSKAEICST